MPIAMIKREKIEELLNLSVNERRQVLKLLQESLPAQDEDPSQSTNGDQVSPAAQWLLSVAGRYSGRPGEIPQTARTRFSELR
jgi:hypothetical protein